jgi:hypothetical protein
VSINDHLPDWLASYNQQVADELQVPLDAVSLLSIGAVSAAINGGASTMPTETWAEPVSLYVLTLLPSGEGKSPMFNRLIDPITQAFEEVTGIHAATDAKYQSIRNRVNRKYVKRVESQAMTKVGKGQMSLEEAVAEVAEAERQIAMFNSVAVPLNILTDTTPSALLDAMVDNGGRVVIATPEAEGLLNFRGASKEGILKGYDGDTLTQARRGTGLTTIARPVVTSMVAMQPTVLGSLGADMVNRGLMPRFLISYPESKLGQRESRPRLVTPEAEEGYLGEMTRIVKTYSEKAPKLVSWDRAAVKEIGLWRDEIEPLLAPGEMLSTIAAWASKVRGGHFIRLATILAIANDRDMVAIGDCQAAKAILRSLMVDARRAFGEMGASFADDDLVHLMAKVGNVTGTFGKRLVMRKSNRFMADRARCSAALDKAVEDGLLGTKGTDNNQVWWVVD